MNDKGNAEMIEFWNGEGGQRWVRFQDILDTSLLPFGHRAMTASAVKAGERVIDVGCGCGDTSFELARRVGSDGGVLGVDASDPILNRAMSRMSLAEATSVKFERGDAQIHRFEGASFDLIFSRFGVMFFENPVAAFSNLQSALKPGGRLAFVCWQPARENSWVSLPVGVAAVHVPPPTPPGPEEPGPFSFGDPERVRKILADAGFIGSEIKSYDTPFNIGNSGGIDEAVEFFMQIGPTARMIAEADADEATRSRIADDLRSSLKPHDTGQGLVMNAKAWVVTARKP
jgi:SAM-dependent methyltransferase